MINIITEDWAPIYLNGEKTKYIVNRYTADIVNSKTGLTLKHIKDKDGYHRINLNHKGKAYNRIVHRLVYMSFYGTDEFNDDINQINHKDGNKDNNSLENLEPCNTKYNIRHAIEHGLRDTRGVNSSLNKYPESLIHTICKMLEDGNSVKYIAKTLNIPNTNVSDIKRGRTWPHISKQYKLPDYNHRKSETIICDIICDIINGFDNREIAKYFGVDHKYVSLIRNKKIHKDLFDKVEQELSIEKGSTTIENNDMYNIYINL